MELKNKREFGHFLTIVTFFLRIVRFKKVKLWDIKLQLLPFIYSVAEVNFHREMFIYIFKNVSPFELNKFR